MSSINKTDVSSESKIRRAFNERSEGRRDQQITVMAIATTDQQRAWLNDIERLKGLMIVFVVWGHVYDPDLAGWALSMRHAIYAFHMPVFMFVSGYVYVHVGAHLVQTSYGAYALKRASRLLIPFLAIAAIVIAGKLVFQTFLSVNKPIDNIANAITTIFIHTEQSPVRSIWYLFVLFTISVLVPILVGGRRSRLVKLGVLGVILHIAHVAMFYAGIVLDYLYLNKVIMYFGFFMYGALAREFAERWIECVTKVWPGAFILFIIFEYVTWESEWRYMLVGGTGVVLFHGIVRSRAQQTLGFLEVFGRNVMSIYLFNLMFIGLARGVFVKMLSPTEHAFALVGCATALGLLGPILIKHTVSAFRPLRRVALAIR